MAQTTAISWCDATINWWIGCTKVSPACDGCYAEALMDKRYGRVEWGAPGKGVGTRTRTSEANWKEPHRWNRKAERDGTRPFVFSSSLSDIFDNQVPPEWRADAFAVMRATPRLIYLLLTKRPQNIVKLSEAAGGLPSNCAIGTTVEDQTRADMNVPALLNAKAALDPLFAFLSCEPLLGPVDLQYPVSFFPDGPRMCCGGYDCGCMGLPIDPPMIYGIDWIITGGETDQGKHKARPTHPDWLRSLRDQCVAAGIAYHHKQHGEWIGVPDLRRLPDGGGPGFGAYDHCKYDCDHEAVRVGKHRAGRLLDGVQHNGRPEVRS